MVGEWCEAHSYPSLGVPVADGCVEGDGDEEGEEDGPLDDDASLRGLVFVNQKAVPTDTIKSPEKIHKITHPRVPKGNVLAILHHKALGHSRGGAVEVVVLPRQQHPREIHGLVCPPRSSVCFYPPANRKCLKSN